MNDQEGSNDITMCGASEDRIRASDDKPLSNYSGDIRRSQDDDYEDDRVNNRHRNSHSSSRRRRSMSSEGHYRSRNSDAKLVHVLDIKEEDASFILGAGGRTKRKLSQVCGADLTIEQRNGKTILEIRGTMEAIDKAILYVGFVVQQRVGAVKLPEDAEKRSDLTIIEVPQECVGYVTGRKGMGLRTVEEEWGTLMFFTDLRIQKESKTEKLAIFGPLRGRRGSELKVMSAVEQKMPGYYTSNVTERESDNPDFDTDYIFISDADYSYALGQKGSTRKKLARASGALLEYVGRIAFVSGTREERLRAREYLKWLCQQRTTYVHVDTEGRTDCTVVKIPLDAVAYITGSKGSNLRRVEDETGTFIFLDGNRGGEEERLLIFGFDSRARERAVIRIEDRVDEKLSGRARPLGNYNNRGGRRRSNSPRYGDRYAGRRYDNRYDSRNNYHRGGGYRSPSPYEYRGGSSRGYGYKNKSQSGGYYEETRGRYARSRSASPEYDRDRHYYNRDDEYERQRYRDYDNYGRRPGGYDRY